MLRLLALSSAFVSVTSLCTLSNVLGDHMVLQRAPGTAIVWGFASSGTSVATTLGGITFTSIADASGTWRQTLPGQSANAVGQTISFNCTSGETFALNDVLFGDLHICGGQSNMQFTVGCMGQQNGYDAAAAIAESNNYPSIRTMTVGQTTTSYFPLTQLGAPPILPWSVAGNKSIGLGNWSATSAVCWFYGKNLYDATGVPQGLVSSNYGGTTILSWADNATNIACNQTDTVEPLSDDVSDSFATNASATVGPNQNNGHGVLFNAMIAPLAYGPMGVKTFTWFQGEQNSGSPDMYKCMGPALITSWREYFNVPSAFFGFVELEPWIGMSVNLAVFRAAQLEALKLSNVGFAIGTDIGDPLGPFGSVHPRNKTLVGARLAAAALTLAYNTPTNYLPPTLATATAGSSSGALTVTVTFDNLPSTLVNAQDHCKTELKVPFASCGFFTILSSDNASLNATATISTDGKSLTLSAAAPAGVTAIGSSFGWNAWPINTVMTAEGLP